jgi:hypothetical protein
MSASKSSGGNPVPKSKKHANVDARSKTSPAPFHRRVPYVQQTERLEVLSNFVSAFAPAFLEDMPASLECLDPLLVVDDDDVTSARNLALIEAFKAIQKISEDR